MQVRQTLVGRIHYVLFGFWYLALFPGRLGYDYALLARLVRKGEETSWWGANYFWLFKFLTFNGRSIFLLSLVGMIVLTFSLQYFISALPISLRAQRKVLTIIMLTPIYGFFGLTVSHDVLQTSGILLLTSVIFRWKYKSEASRNNLIFVASLASFCLLTTHSGVAHVVLLLSLLWFIKQEKVMLITVLATLFFYIPSQLSIQEPVPSSEFARKLPKAGKAIPTLMLIDLKCIVQHPEAEVTTNEWKILEEYSSKDNWKKQTTCSNPDDMLAPLGIDFADVRYSKELASTFIGIVSRSPAIPFVSHIQRSAVALPPPFFLPPTNQIPWNPKIPLGQGTNVALQTGPEMLHPSIDDPILDMSPGFLVPLETLAQAGGLLINQASWFWGWGGMWLWPIFLFFITRMKVLKVSELVVLVSPTLLLHLILFVIGPSSLPRYVMSTVLQGIIFSVALFLERGQNAQSAA
jgi:hypothetical protein